MAVKEVVVMTDNDYQTPLPMPQTPKPTQKPKSDDKRPILPPRRPR